MVNLITEHIDIWTAAQTQKGNGGRGRGNNGNGQNPHGIKKLRALILELAVRGKLVPQDPNDLPAPRSGTWFVYALECKNGSIYIGQTEDILNRWKQHATGKGADWTKRHPPVKLVHWEDYDSQKKAVQREKELKTGFGRKWLKREYSAGRTRQAGEPASVLLERIAKEKARLVKEGKIKKQKPLPEVREDEKPFDLPGIWEWARLGSISQINPRNEAEDNLATSFIPMPLISTSHRGEHAQEIRVWGEIKKGYTHFADGDIGVAKITPCFENSKAVVFSDLENGIGAGTTELHIARPFGSTLVPRYVLLFLKAPIFLHVGKTKMTGTAGQKRLPKEFFSEHPLPIPPLAEQTRIVAKVDELMALCDQLEQKQTDSNATHETLVETLLATLTNAADQRECAEAWQRISSHFDVLFTTEQSIDQLKQTILQLAVMGKLVPQNPSDEPAAVLLEKIAKEKTRLIKEGKITKQKPLPKITDEEEPFELPYGWKLVRFAEISKEISTGPFGSMIHRRDYLEGGIPLINPSHMFDSSIVEEESVSVSMEKAEKLSSYRLEKGDIVMARRGELGRCALVTAREDGWLCGTGSFRLKFHIDICRAYILLLFKTERVRNYLGARSVGTTMTNLNHGILKMMPISLPPAAEQYRIVNKVHELTALCDTLKCQLNDVQTTQVQLADVIAEKAVA